MGRFPGFIALGICALLSLCIGCDKEDASHPPAAPAAQHYEGTILAVGDSLTAGYGVGETENYPAQLERKLHQAGYRWRVVNAGISGETSSGALSRINWVLKLNPDIVILETGANDGLRGLDPRLLRKNLDETLGILQGRKIVVVLAGMKMLRNMGQEYADAFSAVYPEVARKHQVILVPFFLAGVAGDQSLNQPDGIHPTAKGYGIVMEQVFPYVVQAISKRAAAKTQTSPSH